MEAIGKSLIKHLQKWKDDEGIVKLINDLKTVQCVDPSDLGTMVDLVFQEAITDCESAEYFVESVLPSFMRSYPVFREMFVQASLDKFQKDYIADLADKERGGSLVIEPYLNKSGCFLRFE